MGEKQGLFNSKDVIEVPKLNIEEEQILSKLDILKRLSSGTELREALNDIVNGGMGALIVSHNSKSPDIFQGGFRVDCKFTSKRLAELAKMDGAIILSDDFRKILYANTLLIPESSLSTNETGTRHQAAERTAKQINGLVIAVSERRREISIYYQNAKYVLQHTEDLLRRATETLQILEKQRDVFNELLTNLNVLEITDLVSVADVCKILQRIEMIRKMANIINEYIVELGREGVIVRMRMREVIQGVEKEQRFIIKDYSPGSEKAVHSLERLNFEELLDTENIARIIFGKFLDSAVIPRGYRILSKTNLNNSDIDDLIKNFSDFQGILNKGEEELILILGEKTEEFRKDLEHLKEQIMVGKRI